MSTTVTHAATQVHPCVAALRTTGLLEDGADPAGPPRDMSRAHGVWAVRLDEAGDVVVKTAPYAHGDARGTLGAELFVHRMARWCAPLQDALPTLVVADESAMVLVTREVVGPDVPTALLSGRGPDLMHRVGSLLGAVHRATAGLPVPPAPLPHVLAVVHEDRGSTGTASDLVATPAVLAAAQEMRDGGATCLVHHDLKWSNIAVGEAGPVLLDWELAGSGDPAWDLGSLVAEHLVQPGVMADRGPLLTGYAASAHLARRALPVLARRVALAAGLRVAQLALEIEAQHDDLGAAVAHTTARALALLEERPVLEREVLAWLSR